MKMLADARREKLGGPLRRLKLAITRNSTRSAALAKFGSRVTTTMVRFWCRARSWKIVRRFSLAFVSSAPVGGMSSSSTSAETAVIASRWEAIWRPYWEARPVFKPCLIEPTMCTLVNLRQDITTLAGLSKR